MNLKPKIGITFADQEIPTEKEYLEAVTQAGGEPIILRPSSRQSSTELDGLILAGGEDVDPKFYGEPVEPFCEKIDRKRDEFEIALVKQFVDHEKPVFAICRGIQVLNVALGGSLYQDLDSQFEQELLTPHQEHKNLSREQKRAFRHPIKIKPGTLLHKLFGDRLEVNSRHHQALKKIGAGLQVTAESSDGVVEGVESNNHPLVLGVEWHPESSEVYPTFAPLFRAFISRCNSKKVS